MARLLDKEQEIYLKSIVLGRSTKECTDLLNSQFGTNFTCGQIKNYKCNHHIKSGLTGHFPKGHIPANKGKKMPKEIYDKAKRTMFKSGQKPKNTDPIGTEKLFSDGYVYVKIDEQPKAPKMVNWKQKHKLIWERKNGPIPKGHKIIFADQDRSNFDINNLVLVSDAELLIMNKKGLIYDNKDLTKVGASVAKVINKTNKLKKEEKRRAKIGITRIKSSNFRAI